MKKTKVIKFFEGKGYRVSHPIYGEGRVEAKYKIKNIKWLDVRINANTVISTPENEWTIRNEGV